jgi:hypothetical protein
MTSTDKHIAAAEALGQQHGAAAGSWVIDGNTTRETARAIVQGYEDGDPGVMDMCPSPLSGEWADGMTADMVLREVCAGDGLLVSVGDDFRYEAISDAYEQGFSLGFWDQVIADARGFGHVA